MYIGYSNPASREVRWFSKRETEANTYRKVGRVVEGKEE